MTIKRDRDWNSTASGWKKWQPISEKAAQTVTEIMLDMAAVSPGDTVIDLATGIGDTAVACARRVGPTGRVLATDGAEAMLSLAERFVEGKGFNNVSYKVANLDNLNFGREKFDAAICRWGLMFAKNLTNTLKLIRAHVRPEGCFSAIVWGPPERAEVQSFANGILMDSLGLPPIPTGDGTPFALSDKNALERDFENAGYSNVESQTVDVRYKFSTAEEYVRYRRDRSSLEKLIAHVPEIERERGWAAVVSAARKRAGPDHSIWFVSEAVVISGKNAVQQYF